jgi:signal transduction histidine kinase
LRFTTGHSRQHDGYLVGNLESELEAVRQRLAQCLQNEQLRLEQMKLASVAEFAAGAAHEINTPLAIISGQAQHLLRSEEDPERMQTLERIVTQAQRIHVLLRDLLTFARPPQLKPKRLDATAFVQGVVEGLRNYAVRKQVRLEVAKARKITVRGDAGLLENAVAALVRNALEAAPSGGTVRVSVSQGNREILIAIEDDGPGLTAQQREHLFDPFFSGRAAGRGAGLGLSKAWRIAQLHGGTVELSPDGSPTRFTLRLPATPTNAKRKPVKPRPQRAAARRK